MSEWITFGLLAAVLIAAAIRDWRSGLIPNVLTYPAMLGGVGLAGIVGLIAGGGAGAWTGVQSSAVAMTAGLIGLGLVRLAGGMGWGDVKLLGALGAISADWRCVLAAAVYAFVLAGVMAVALMVRHGLVRQTLGRLFGAAMLAGGRVRPQFPDDSPRVPFGIALALGGILAAAELLLGLDTPWKPHW
jgi:prepilin peptidase CpaA